MTSLSLSNTHPIIKNYPLVVYRTDQFPAEIQYKIIQYFSKDIPRIGIDYMAWLCDITPELIDKLIAFKRITMLKIIHKRGLLAPIKNTREFTSLFMSYSSYVDFKWSVETFPDVYNIYHVEKLANKLQYKKLKFLLSKKSFRNIRVAIFYGDAIKSIEIAKLLFDKGVIAPHPDNIGFFTSIYVHDNVIIMFYRNMPFTLNLATALIENTSLRVIKYFYPKIAALPIDDYENLLELCITNRSDKIVWFLFIQHQCAKINIARFSGNICSIKTFKLLWHLYNKYPERFYCETHTHRYNLSPEKYCECINEHLSVKFCDSVYMKHPEFFNYIETIITIKYDKILCDLLHDVLLYGYELYNDLAVYYIDMIYTILHKIAPVKPILDRAIQDKIIQLIFSNKPYLIRTLYDDRIFSLLNYVINNGFTSDYRRCYFLCCDNTKASWGRQFAKRFNLALKEQICARVKPRMITCIDNICE